MDTKQIGGDHYSRLKVQPWDAMEAAFPESFPDHLLMCAMKYIMRDKDDKYIDIQKAAHYLEKWLTLNVPPQTVSHTSSSPLIRAYQAELARSGQYSEQGMTRDIGIQQSPQIAKEAPVPPRKRGRPRKSSQQPVASPRRK